MVCSGTSWIVRKSLRLGNVTLSPGHRIRVTAVILMPYQGKLTQMAGVKANLITGMVPTADIERRCQ